MAAHNEEIERFASLRAELDEILYQQSYVVYKILSFYSDQDLAIYYVDHKLDEHGKYRFTTLEKTKQYVNKLITKNMDLDVPVAPGGAGWGLMYPAVKLAFMALQAFMPPPKVTPPDENGVQTPVEVNYVDAYIPDVYAQQQIWDIFEDFTEEYEQICSRQFAPPSYQSANSQ
jgi:hypothetical protein